MTEAGPVALAEVRRSGFREGSHVGHAVVLAPDGSVRAAWGDPGAAVFPRSCAKPLQASAMVRAGLDLPSHLLALAAASHSGEPFHVAGVREILASAGLTEDALRTPPDYPLDPVERDVHVAAGHPETRIDMNCSGKHAAMLATCVTRGWPLASYLDPRHPLQAAIRAEVEVLADASIEAVGVDGCGAPVLAIPLAALAAAFAGCVLAAPGSPPRRVADAMRAHPEWVGGTRRDVTAFMSAVPGLLAKDGAEAVYAVALPDGAAAAVKVLDGADRARSVVMAALLREMGVASDAIDDHARAELLGGGVPVGEIRACL